MKRIIRKILGWVLAIILLVTLIVLLTSCLGLGDTLITLAVSIGGTALIYLAIILILE